MFLISYHWLWRHSASYTEAFFLSASNTVLGDLLMQILCSYLNILVLDKKLSQKLFTFRYVVGFKNCEYTDYWIFCCVLRYDLLFFLHFVPLRRTWWRRTWWRLTSQRGSYWCRPGVGALCEGGQGVFHSLLGFLDPPILLLFSLLWTGDGPEVLLKGLKGQGSHVPHPNVILFNVQN